MSAKSRIASLPKDLSIPYSNRSIYLSPNKTAQEIAWKQIDEDGHEGVIALSATDAQSRGLLPAQRWPWDKSKSIYIINGYHQLHCVVSLIQDPRLHALDLPPKQTDNHPSKWSTKPSKSSGPRSARPTTSTT